MKTLVKKEVNKILKECDSLDPERVVKSNHCKVLYSELGEDTFGFTSSSNRCHTIVVNEDLNSNWKDFVLLHELGHVKLHKGIATPFFKKVSSYSVIPKIEKEANEFSLALLASTIAESEEMTNYEILDYLGLPYELERFL